MRLASKINTGMQVHISKRCLFMDSYPIRNIPTTPSYAVLTRRPGGFSPMSAPPARTCPTAPIGFLTNSHCGNYKLRNNYWLRVGKAAVIVCPLSVMRGKIIGYGLRLSGGFGFLLRVLIRIIYLMSNSQYCMDANTYTVSRQHGCRVVRGMVPLVAGPREATQAWREQLGLSTGKDGQA